MNIEKAAQKLADCMDYPWEFMPEQGRENMRNHVKAIFEAANSSPAEDARAVVEEPVAWFDPESGAIVTDKLKPLLCETGFDVPLYRHPQRPVVMPERLREIWLFLDGRAELNGCVFGEKPEGRHNFWWRKELRAALEELFPQQ